MKHILITVLIAVSFVVAVPVSSKAADRPAWHVGSFQKVASLKNCISFAKEALARQHYKVFSEDNYTVIGGDDHVVVEVACAPQQDGKTHVVVTAFSSDSKTAEAARNTVREHIVKVRIID